MHISAIILGLAAAVSAPQPPNYQAGDKVAAPLIDAIARCLDIAVDAERLACSDTAARALVEATRKREVVVVDRAEMKSTRRSLFGFTLPKIGLFGDRGPDSADDIDRIETTVSRTASAGYGKFLITVPDGAQWQTTDSWPLGGGPRVGEKVTIRKGAVGSYFLRTSGSPPIRAMRVK